MNKTTVSCRVSVRTQGARWARQRLVLITASIASASVMGSARADELFRDEFDDGVIPPRYTVFGGATMVETNGRLVVTMPSPESGIQIDTADFPTQACFVLRYSIPHHGSPRVTSSQASITHRSH
jgi:hypothetical protein